MNQSKIGDRKGQTFCNSKTNYTTEEAIKHIFEDMDSDNSSFFSCFFHIFGCHFNFLATFVCCHGNNLKNYMKSK